MEEKKVSILVAIYNIEKYIGKCIESIINQDYKNLEIILVDDNSKDNSGSICDMYATKDNRIKVIHHKINKKLPGVRNTGLDNATGDYIVFVDGDDWLADDFVSYMMKVINKTNSDMAINLINFTTRDLKQISEEKDFEIWSPEKAVTEFIYPHLTIGAWNKIYKREVIEKNGLRFKEGLFTAEGYRFVSDLMQRVNSIGVGCRKVYYYRLNNTQSATTKYDVRQSMGAIEVANSIKNDLVIKTPSVLNAINQHIWLNHFWNIRQIIALKKQKEMKEQYTESIMYVKNHYKEICLDEKRINKKVKYFLSGKMPKVMARIKNFQFNLKLKMDLFKYRNESKDA